LGADHQVAGVKVPRFGRCFGGGADQMVATHGLDLLQKSRQSLFDIVIPAPVELDSSIDRVAKDVW
jgi:hypothetical protein